MRVGDGQTDFEASLAARAVEDNLSAVRAGDLLGDGKPEADAFGFAGRERFKKTREDVGRRAGAVIEDADDDLTNMSCFDFNLYFAAGAGGVGGVEDEVDEQLAELARVGT